MPRRRISGSAASGQANRRGFPPRGRRGGGGRAAGVTVGGRGRAGFGRRRVRVVLEAGVVAVAAVGTLVASLARRLAVHLHVFAK